MAILCIPGTASINLQRDHVPGSIFALPVSQFVFPLHPAAARGSAVGGSLQQVASSLHGFLPAREHPPCKGASSLPKRRPYTVLAGRMEVARLGARECDGRALSHQMAQASKQDQLSKGSSWEDKGLKAGGHNGQPSLVNPRRSTDTTHHRELNSRSKTTMAEDL